METPENPARADCALREEAVTRTWGTTSKAAAALLLAHVRCRVEISLRGGASDVDSRT